MTSLTDLPLTFTFGQALAAGITRGRLRRALRDGEVHRTRRGRYRRASALVEAAENWEMARGDHLDRLRDALAVHPGCAASHASAAVVHDLPLMMSPIAEVELVRVEDCPRSERLPGMEIHHADSTPTDTVMVGGIRSTGVARTIADCLRSRRLPHGLALLDQALRENRVTLAEVTHELAQQRHWVGRPKAMSVLELADPRRESYGESYSFGVLHLGELPMPIPQVEIYDEYFTFVARVDGLLDHEGVVTEVHGQMKYFLDPVSDDPESSVREKLVAEHRRKMRIERLGLAVAEWTVDDALHRPELLTGGVSRATRRAEAQDFRGWVKWDGAFRKLPLLPRPPHEVPGGTVPSHTERSVALG